VRAYFRARWVLIAAGAALGCGRSMVGFDDGLDPAASGSGGAGGDGEGGRGGTPSRGGTGGAGVAGGGAGSAGDSTGGTAAGRAGDAGAGTSGAGSAGKSGLPIDPELEVPVPRLPENGGATGSVWAEAARRPFFLWQGAPGTESELEVDDSCPPNDFQGCEFPSPEWTLRGTSDWHARPEQGLPVAEQAPVGRRYYWRVRACTADACSRWSSVRYVDVGRQRNDFDGDGYADLVLADQGSISSGGRVMVAFGPVPSERAVVFRDIESIAIQDRFGIITEPLGDMDADGFSDLLITAPGGAEDRYGKAFVYFGSERFSEPSTHIRLEVSGDEPGDGVGFVALPAGDVDADGFQDFVLGSGATESPVLRLCRGFFRSIVAGDVGVLRPGEFTEALSAGDVTGDGHSDLFSVSVGPGYHARYDLLRGGPDGFGEVLLSREREGYPVAPHAILSDVTGDGFRDIGFASNPPADPGQDRIWVSQGDQAPSFDTELVWPGGLVPVEDSAFIAELNAPVAAGDVNGDGYEDALVGVGWHSSTRIQANLYLGALGSRTAPDAVYLDQGAELLFISTARPKAAGDVNGDGFGDVWLKDDTTFTGALFFGSADLDTLPDATITLPPE
jgi:hypothetical protein